MSTTRVLITVFDALRPEFVTAELMPNLHAFAASGVRYPNARSTYPTETRVNQSAVTTGCMPWRHGVVGNKMVAPDVSGDALLNTGDDAQLRAAMNQGPVLGKPNLAQRLMANGRSYASLSAGTPGGGRLINWSAEQGTGFRLAMRAPECCVPAGVFEQIAERIGDLPGYDLPATKWISWAVNAYLNWIEPEIAPDVMLLWLCEPDESFHWRGIGSPDALTTMRHADAEFGRILSAHAEDIASGRLHIVTLSDHGQISLSEKPLDLPSLVNETGLSLSCTVMGEADGVIAVDSAGGIWLRDRDPTTIRTLVEWLRMQDWCGPIFTRDGVSGTLQSRELRVDHDRAPDISLALRASDESNEFGVAGMTRHDASYPVGGGCHGGLHPRELNTFLAMAGERLRAGEVIEAPAGNTDILPTVLSLLDLPAANEIDGRALKEAFVDGPKPESVAWQEKVLTSSNSIGPRSHLSVSDLGTTRYLNAGWADG